MTFFIINQTCNGCLACVETCPARALDVKDEDRLRILLHNPARCARCATCWRVCPQGAVEFQHLLEDRWDPVATLNLVRCEICNEPVHCNRLKETLPEDTAFTATALCPQHRARKSSAALIVSSAAGERGPRGPGETE